MLHQIHSPQKPIYDAQYKADEGNLQNVTEKDIEQNFIIMSMTQL